MSHMRWERTFRRKDDHRVQEEVAVVASKGSEEPGNQLWNELPCRSRIEVAYLEAQVISIFLGCFDHYLRILGLS